MPPKKKPRVEKKTKTELRGLCLHGQPLPTSIECIIFQDLDIWTLGILGFTSRGLRSSLMHFLNCTTHLTIRDTEFPRARTYSYWMLRQVAEQCRSLRSIRFSMTVMYRDTSRLQMWLSRLVRDNRATFQRFHGKLPSEMICPVLLSTMVQCPGLLTLANLFQDGGRGYTNAHESIVEYALGNCPKLTDMELSSGVDMLVPNRLVQLALTSELPLTKLALTLRAETVGFLSSAASLTSLCVGVSTYTTTTSFYRLLSQELVRLPNLTTLELFVPWVAEQDGGDIVWRLPTVTKLTMNEVEGNNGDVCIPIDAPKLQEFTGYGDMDPDRKILDTCLELRSYCIAQVEYSMYDHSFVDPERKNRLESLQTLKCNSYDFSGAQLRELCARWTNLSELDIHCYYDVSESDIWQLLWQLPKLRIAALYVKENYNSYKITSSPGPRQSLQTASCLEELHLQVATDAFVEANPIDFPRLRTLLLQSNAVQLERPGVLLQRMPHLKTFAATSNCSLTGFFGCKERMRMQLTQLTLLAVNKLTGTDVIALIQPSTATLRHLDIQNCPMVDEFVLAMLFGFQLRPPLESFCFSFPMTIELATIRAAIKSLPTLHQFKIDHRNLSSSDLIQLVADFPEISIGFL